MDPLSHAAMGRVLVGLPREAPRASVAAAAVLAALSPDIDAALMPFGWDRYLRAHEIVRNLRKLLTKRELQMEPVDLDEIARTALLLIKADAARRGIAITATLDGALPAILGDPVHLQQVLLNLIVNACDAMADVPPDDRVITIGTADRGDSVDITVSDHGPGIPPNAVEAVFEPFVTTKEHGLGLGLAICRSIVSSHGGRMWASNNPDRGATFHVVLPRRRTSDHVAAHPPSD